MTDDPMPVFVLKAKDNFAPRIIAEYIRQLDIQQMYDQAQHTLAALAEVSGWRERHPELCKWPDHEHIPAGQPGSGSETQS